MLQRLKGIQNGCQKTEKLHLPNAIEKSPSNNRSLVDFHIEYCSTSHSSFIQAESFTLCHHCENLREGVIFEESFTFLSQATLKLLVFLQFCISLTEMASENKKATWLLGNKQGSVKYLLFSSRQAYFSTSQMCLIGGSHVFLAFISLLRHQSL